MPAKFDCLNICLGWSMRQKCVMQAEGCIFQAYSASLQGAFRGRVYGPLLLEVSVQDGLHARVLESHFSGEQLNYPPHLRSFWKQHVLSAFQLMDTAPYLPPTLAVVDDKSSMLQLHVEVGVGCCVQPTSGRAS